MARRSKGPLVFFKKVRRAATKPKPYLLPGAEIGRRILVAQLRQSIATMGTVTRASMERAAESAARIGAFAALQAAQRKAPVNTGRLRASLNVRRRSSTLWTVGTNVFYAHWVEKGTRSRRIIRPRRAKVLAFYWANAPAAIRQRFARRRRGRRR